MLFKYFDGLLLPNIYTKRLSRYVTNETKTWERKYKRVTRVELEKYWKKKLSEKSNGELLASEIKKDQKKFYCLSMFPYPSGRLHMGHVRVYTISDTCAHFYRMNGYDVVHPMGWDAFGLPAENAARDRKLNPGDWTRSNISYMKNQLKDLNLMFDWDREVSTCDPGYYKWTQYIFIKLFDAGLAYQKEAVVNWDPVDQTVLADEQVDENGCSWRSGAKVEQRYLKQWFFKTTEYAQDLLDSLHEIDEDYGIKAMQRNWLGEIDGCYFDLDLTVEEAMSHCCLPVFCSHPEYIKNASHIVIQSKFKDEFVNLLRRNGSEKICENLNNTDDSDDLIQGCFVKNPYTGKLLPVVMSNKFEETFRRATAIFVLPLVDETSKIMADQLRFGYDVSDTGDTRDDILRKGASLGITTGKMTSSKLCDWLISRQRYWGTPIPVIHCPTHGPVAVPKKDLPVELPDLQDLSLSSGVSPLESATDWVNTTCPKCGAPSKRETDTMDTFVDSSWYFLRYTDPQNTNFPFSKNIADGLMPVDLYIGGKEHATLHLYYARFFSHFLSKQGMHSHKEPFRKLLAQGIIKGLTHQVKATGKYISSSEVQEKDGKLVTKDNGEEVLESFQKMSKSKLNGIDPEDFVNEWGISITRLYVLYAAAPFDDIHWDVKTDVIPGVMRWQLKTWTCVTRLLDARKKIPKTEMRNVRPDLVQEVDKLNDVINTHILDVTRHFTKDCLLSAAITCLMTLAKALFHTSGDVINYSSEYERGVCALVIMSAPMVPHFASELWSGLKLMEHKLTEHNWEGDVLEQSWPQQIINTSVPFTKYKVKVNERTCYAISVPSELEDFSEVKLSLLNHRKVIKSLKGGTPNGFDIDKENSVIHISSVQ